MCIITWNDFNIWLTCGNYVPFTNTPTPSRRKILPPVIQTDARYLCDSWASTTDDGSAAIHCMRIQNSQQRTQFRFVRNAVKLPNEKRWPYVKIETMALEDTHVVDASMGLNGFEVSGLTGNRPHLSRLHSGPD